MELSAQIALVEKAMRALEVEWERYFAGDRRTPPHEDRKRVQRRLRLLAERPARGVEQFKIQQLQHRFQSYSQMWERVLREREEGRRRAAAAKIADEGPAPSPNAPASASVDSSEKSSDLYDRYVTAKRELGQEVGVDRDAFERQLRQQRDRVENRLGSGVRFEVVVDGGKVKLAARKTASGRNQE